MAYLISLNLKYLQIQFGNKTIRKCQNFDNNHINIALSSQNIIDIIVNMIKFANTVLFKNLIPLSKNLRTLPRAVFSTDPFKQRPNVQSPPKSFYQNDETLRASHELAKNEGLSKFISRTYNTTGLSLMGALGAAYAGAAIPALAMNPMATVIVGGIATIASFIGVQFMKPNYVVDQVNGGTVYRTQNSIGRLLLYGLGVASLGLSASPMFLYTQMISTSIIPTALGITAGIFGGASAMAYMMPKDKMLSYGRLFMGGLIGLIAMQLVGLGAAYFMGPNALSMLLFNINTYGGILLFAGLIAYDTHVAIKSYEMGNADHLGMSIQLLLNLWNILIRVMEILGRMKGD